MTSAPSMPNKRRQAFTLVELLVAIAIIGILMAIAIPAIFSAVTRAKVTAIKLEASALEQAIEQYRQKYGDYPPDFSDWNVVTRHYRKVFPRMSTNDFQLLFNLVHSGSPAVFQAAQIDRAEALVWTLGGYSDDIQRPFTGTGGPLSWTGNGSNKYTDASVTDVQRQTPTNFQANADRINSLFDFQLNRLNYSEVNSSALLTGTNRYLSTDDGDLFLTYAAKEGGAPFVYFDSRTYDLYNATIGDFNGYGSSSFGYVRPYFSDIFEANTSGAPYASDAAALKAWQFVNPNTFQLISAGIDDNFGLTASFDVDGDSVNEALYFQYPTGNAIAPRTDVDSPGELIVAGVSGYQESSKFNVIENHQLDNVTNFSNAQIVDDVP